MRPLITTSVFLIAVTLIGFLGWGTVQSNRLINAEDHSNKVLAAVEMVKESMVDAETGERGFVVVGDERYLEPYNDATNVLASQLQTLQGLIDPVTFAVIEQTSNAKMDIITKIIEVRRTEDLNAVVKKFKYLGKDSMDAFRAAAMRLIVGENARLSDIIEESRRVLQFGMYGMIALLLCVVYLVVFPWGYSFKLRDSHSTLD